MKKVCLIFGISGQIGSYLAEDLLSNDEDTIVHGIIRRASYFNTGRIEHLYEKYLGKRLFLHYGDATDPISVEQIIEKTKPDFIYSLAAQSHVKVSFEIPVYTAQCDALGQLYILEAIKKHCPKTKIYQASTSEMFGGQFSEMPENGFSEITPFHPRSPYGVAKLYAYWITKNYREAYGLFCCNGLLFNTESSRRGETFVTRKITLWMKQLYKNILNGTIEKTPCLQLGNLNAVRDWQHAKDAIKGMQLILAQEEPGDYVISTGETHSVKDFINECIKWLNVNEKMNLTLIWIGEGIDEKGFINGHNLISVNEKYFRPSEVDYLKGDSSKLRKLGWKPLFSFEELVSEMMNSDVKSS